MPVGGLRADVLAARPVPRARAGARARSRARRRGLPRRAAQAAPSSNPPASPLSASPLTPDPRGASQVHTGAWPYHCTMCNKGHKRAGAPRAGRPCAAPPTRPITPLHALGRVGDALLQGHRRVQVRLEHEGAPRPDQLQKARGALRPRRGARAAGLSRPARRPARWLPAAHDHSHDAARATTRPPRARAPHDGRA